MLKVHPFHLKKVQIFLSIKSSLAAAIRCEFSLFFCCVTRFHFQALSGVAQGSEAKAIYGYRAQNKDELSFMAGDKMKVTNRKINSFQTEKLTHFKRFHGLIGSFEPHSLPV